MGHQHLPQHRLGQLVRLVGGLAESDAALEAVLEDAFAPAAGMNLGFDREKVFFEAAPQAKEAPKVKF